jgi:hypothetical protein
MKKMKHLRVSANNVKCASRWKSFIRLSIRVVILSTVSSFSACQKDGTVEPATHVLVQGTWQGTLDDKPFDITFIEGEFERGVTLSGSAHLSKDTQTVFYLVMNGTHNRVDTVWFSLYKVPVVAKEDYHLKGVLRYTTISGAFRELNSNGEVIRSGTWQVERVP